MTYESEQWGGDCDHPNCSINEYMAMDEDGIFVRVRCLRCGTLIDEYRP